jgi:hypothetical protein
MKHLFLWVFTALITAAPFLIRAQQATLTVGKTAHPGNPKPPDHFRFAKLKNAINHQYARVTAALRLGKITEDEATALNGQILGIQTAMDDDMLENKPHYLSKSQESQLDISLNEISKEITTAGGFPDATLPEN